MTKRCRTSWRRRARGFTLIEALAASLLLGSMLVAMLLAMSNFITQDRRAQDRLEACARMDDLLQAWWANPKELPRDARGTLPGQAGWQWRTQVVNRPAASALNTQVLAVELFAPPPYNTAPASRVELLLPLPEPPPGTQESETPGVSLQE